VVYDPPRACLTASCCLRNVPGDDALPPRSACGQGTERGDAVRSSNLTRLGLGSAARRMRATRTSARFTSPNQRADHDGIAPAVSSNSPRNYHQHTRAKTVWLLRQSRGHWLSPARLRWCRRDADPCRPAPRDLTPCVRPRGRGTRSHGPRTVAHQRRASVGLVHDRGLELRADADRAATTRRFGHLDVDRVAPVRRGPAEPSLTMKDESRSADRPSRRWPIPPSGPRSARPLAAPAAERFDVPFEGPAGCPRR